MHNDIIPQDDVQLGFIMKLEGDLAKVRVAPNADCDNCGACDIKHMEIVAYNAVKAAPGQKVRFTMIKDNMVTISFMIFVLPMLSLFAGLYAGSLVASLFRLNETALTAVGGILFLMIAIVIIYKYDKKYKSNKSNFPQIIEVIN